MKIRLPLSDKETILSDFAAYNFFLWLNLLVFFDRGVIPGAIIEFDKFIVRSTGSSQPDILFGILQAFFVIGLISGSLALSYFVVRYDRFLVATLALLIWILALILSGIAFYASSFELLLFARTLAGFGEASILFDIPSWIQSVAPSSHRGTWLGIFYSTIPLGTSLGYGYSAAIAQSNLTWSFAFFFEAFLAVPLVIFLSSITDDSPEDDESTHIKKATEDNVVDDGESPDHLRDDYATLEYGPSQSILNKQSSPTKTSILVSGDGSLIVTRNRRNSALQTVLGQVTLYEGLSKAVQSPVFVTIVLAGAAQAATIAAWTSFGSAILINLGYYEDELSSSTAFGILISMAGLIGTPLGGYLLDRLDPGGHSDKTMQKHVYVYYRRQPFLHTVEEKEAGESDDERTVSEKTNINSGKSAAVATADVKYYLYVFTQRACALFYWISLATFVCFTASVFVKPKGLFLFVLAMGFLLSHATSAAVLVIQSIELKHSYQCISSEIGLLALHLIGDVPANIVAGFLKSKYASSCSSDPFDATCRAKGGKLRWVILYIGIWSFAAVLFAAIAWWRCSDLSIRKLKEFKLQCSDSGRSRRQRNKKKRNKKPLDQQHLLS